MQNRGARGDDNQKTATYPAIRNSIHRHPYPHLIGTFSPGATGVRSYSKYFIYGPPIRRPESTDNHAEKKKKKIVGIVIR